MTDNKLIRPAVQPKEAATNILRNGAIMIRGEQPYRLLKICALVPLCPPQL